MSLKKMLLSLAAIGCVACFSAVIPLQNNARNGILGYTAETSSDTAAGFAGEILTAGMLDDLLGISSDSAADSVYETSPDAVREMIPESSDNAVILNKTAAFADPRDIFKNWGADFSFLTGGRGDGSEERPYQISTAAQLKGLSELAAKEMKLDTEIGRSEGDCADFREKYFELARNIDLSGIAWIPIGFNPDTLYALPENEKPFYGHFDGRGHRITNLAISQSDYPEAGLFGIAADSEIHDLEVTTAKRVTAGDCAGILVGRAVNSVIRDAAVSGKAGEAKFSGGIAGSVTDCCIENCTASSVAVDTGTDKTSYGGGIAGSASGSVIADCVVVTGKSPVTCIQGQGYIGGITGLLDNSNIFNVSVDGRIGGSGSAAVGGIAGEYLSGKIKVVRFSGNIASTGNGNSAHEGMVIGTHGGNFSDTGQGKAIR